MGWEIPFPIIFPGTISVLYCFQYKICQKTCTEVHIEKEKDELGCLGERKDPRVWLINEF